MTHCVPRPISMLILQTPQFQTPCTTNYAQIGWGKKKKRRTFLKTILLYLCVVISPYLVLFSLLFCQLCPTYFFQLCRGYFFQLCPKYFFAPLVVLPLTNVPCLTLSPRQNPKHHFLNFIMTKKCEERFNENRRTRKGKY